MIRSLFVAAVLVGMLLPARAQQGVSAPKPFVKRISTTVAGRYIVITPQSYKTQRDTRWPLIVFLHGGEQGGQDMSRVTQHALPKIALEDPEFPFILLVPQIGEGKTWEAGAVLSLVKQVVRTHRIDSSRIYATGVSLGGYGVWELAARYPEWFAAVAPIAGGGNTLPLKMAETSKLEALKSLGIWAFHGGSDSSVDPSESQRMVEEFQRLGATDARATIYPGGPHDIWDRAYRDPAFYAWLNGHARTPAPR